MELPESTQVTIEVPADSDESSFGPELFGAVHFTKAGTYTLKIREVANDGQGWTSDTADWTLTVQVEDISSVLLSEPPAQTSLHSGS